MPNRRDRIRLSHQLTDSAHTRPVVTALRDLTKAVNDHDAALPDLLAQIDVLSRRPALTIPEVQKALQPRIGIAPVSLPAETGTDGSRIQYGTHNARKATATGAALDQTLWFETDRHLLYLYEYPAGWYYVAGVYRTALSGDPDDEPGEDSSDGGDTQDGVALAGADGHPAGAYDGSAYRAGLIIGGVGNEYPALLDVAADQATRDANEAELLARIIWHLVTDGYSAGYQRNPSGLLGSDKIALVEDGVTRAFDVFSHTVYTSAFTLMALQVSPANLVPDAGTSD